MNLSVILNNKTAEEFAAVAVGNRRSKSAEANVAIEAHLAKHRTAMKAGAKMPKPAVAKAQPKRK